MITLCEANRAGGSTKRIFAVSLIFPVFMGATGWALGSGAAPHLSFGENYLAMTGVGMILLAIVALPVPYLFRWDWQSKYYGSCLFPFVLNSAMWFYPSLCIIVYGKLPKYISIGLFAFELVAVFLWCKKIAGIYKKIFISENLFNQIYIEKSHAVYYLLQEDKRVVKKNLGFDFSPSPIFLIIPILCASAMIPFASSISGSVGIPFTHVFCAVGAFPLGMTFIGMGVKGWIVFYYFPYKISRSTNKPVYVDMSSFREKYSSDFL